MLFSHLIDGCDHWSVADAFYFAIMTMFTIGLGDFVPSGLEHGACWWRVVLVFTGFFSLGATTLFVSAVSNWLAAGRQQQRRREKDAARKSRGVVGKMRELSRQATARAVHDAGAAGGWVARARRWVARGGEGAPADHDRRVLVSPKPRPKPPISPGAVVPFALDEGG